MLYSLDPLYWMMLIPAVLLGLWAQFRVKSAFARAAAEPAPMTGAAAARHVLDSAGLQNVAIEPVEGFMTDHYDPRGKVLRLSPEVYQGRTMAAVGVAAHEAGHALQDAAGYSPLSIRNAIVPLANFGSGLGMILIMLGLGFGVNPLWRKLASSRSAQLSHFSSSTCRSSSMPVTARRLSSMRSVSCHGKSSNTFAKSSTLLRGPMSLPRCRR